MSDMKTALCKALNIVPIETKVRVVSRSTKSIWESYGFTLSQWNQMKDSIRDVIVEVAKRASTITYTNLVIEAKVLGLLHNRHSALWAILGEISDKSFKEFEICLSAVVVCGSTDPDGNRGYPGVGFYPVLQKHRDMKPTWSKKKIDLASAMEIGRVHEYFKNMKDSLH